MPKTQISKKAGNKFFCMNMFHYFGYEKGVITKRSQQHHAPCDIHQSVANFCYYWLGKEASSEGCVFCVDQLRLIIKEEVRNAYSGRF